ESVVRCASFILNWSGNTGIRLRATKRAILEPEENKLVLDNFPPSDFEWTQEA
ncbi:hypothetical protein BS47DRAFT_1352686, partial [Hydnum rufescens UP504]